METKNALVRRLVSQKLYKEALSICKDWNVGISPEDRDQLRLGYECMLYPKFYQQLHKDINLEIDKTIFVLNKLYNK